MKNLVFGFMLVATMWSFDLVDRPVIQLTFNYETPIFPPILYLPLAHKPISTDHNNVPRL